MVVVGVGVVVVGVVVVVVAVVTVGFAGVVKIVSVVSAIIIDVDSLPVAAVVVAGVVPSIALAAVTISLDAVVAIAGVGVVVASVAVISSHSSAFPNTFFFFNALLRSLLCADCCECIRIKINNNINYGYKRTNCRRTKYGNETRGTLCGCFERQHINKAERTECAKMYELKCIYRMCVRMCMCLYQESDGFKRKG